MPARPTCCGGRGNRMAPHLANGVLRSAAAARSVLSWALDVTPALRRGPGLPPGPRSGESRARALDQAGAAGPLTADAHLAALAIEHQAELHSTDGDMARFPGLRWRNPLG